MKKRIFWGQLIAALLYIGNSAFSQTIWTDGDFTIPKGHTWINSGNWEYGGDVHIQNINEVIFESNMSGKPNTGVLSIEAGGKLTADGMVTVNQLGPTTGDAVLVTDGGKAFFNGGLTANMLNNNNDYYAVGTIKTNSELHVKGDTIINANFEKGYGLYLGEGTTNSFSKNNSNYGSVSIYSGKIGIYSLGNTDFNQNVNIYLNSNGATGVISNTTNTLSTTTFNGFVTVTNNSISNNTSSAYGLAVSNPNGILNLNSGGKITFGNNYTNGNEIGVYASKGIINITGDFAVQTNSGGIQAAFYATNGGKINAVNSLMDLKGSMYANNSSQIQISMNNGSLWEGASYIGNGSTTDITMAGSQWKITDDSTVTNLNILNGTTIYLNAVPDYSNFTARTLTISEGYHGDNSTIVFNTQLEDDNSITDKMIVEGDTSGTTKVRINNMGGRGAHTENGIELISVLGDSNGEFIKDGRIVAGTYEYFLNRGDGIITDSNNWYLTSTIPSIMPPTVIPPVIVPPVTPPIVIPPVDPGNPSEPEITAPPLIVPPAVDPVYRPESGSYLANAGAVKSLFIHTLHDRLGETQYTDALTNEDGVSSIWVRNVGGYSTFRDGSNQLKTRNKKNIIQLGGDIADWSSNGNNRYHLGLMAGYGFNHSKTESNKTSYTSKGEIEGFNLGIYGTYYANENDKSGFYTDTWLTYSWFDNEVRGQELEREKYKSKGITASLESGYSFKIENDDSHRKTYYIQPKAQIIYMGVDTDNHTEANGTKVETKGDGNIQTRIGARVYANHFNPADKNNSKEIQPFVEANWIHNSKDIKVSMDGINNKIKGTKNIGEVKIGSEIKLNPNFNVWGNVSHQWGGSGYRDTKVTIGLKYSF
ncbi:autotransporter outer membrane beta-barrel domain-containing protein [Fusobacterium sp.]|uniref:autotransporter outer membrane beta-barrel domain-containing protein n=1 Tax=Fusobacterium sp. TaxID=68766 RepID=UPI002901E2F0|nr:autotransporter outer membrane beta-barrel domain-containing protein [Fusobacterium sp.]MDU1911885.1 autotransporter outer membrane beta-barrel domain-containing protein [Fusobacterium sp.]